MNGQYKISREQATEIADAIRDANFRVFGLGHFDLGHEEIINIVMIAANSGDKMKDNLARYYKILGNRYFGRESSYWTYEEL